MTASLRAFTCSERCSYKQTCSITTLPGKILMKKTEWSALTEALQRCLNSRGTLDYNYDAGLANEIARYAPTNYICGTSPQKSDYRPKDRDETLLAIANWSKAMQDEEDTVIITNAQLELQEDDEAAKERILPKLIDEKKVLVRGVTEVKDVKEFPSWRTTDRQQLARSLFDVAVQAIEVFQDTPTALVLFPNLTIDDPRVFGGFFGSPWSTFNNRSLRLKFRNTNPHFQINVATVKENKGGDDASDSRKVGVLFTYTNPW